MSKFTYNISNFTLVHLLTAPTYNTTIFVYRPTVAPTFVPTLTPIGETLPTTSPTNEATLLATELFFSGDTRSVGESNVGDILEPTTANELVLYASAGTKYSLVVLSDGSAAAGGFIENINDYQGHLGIVNYVEGENELETIIGVVDLNGDTVPSPIFRKVYAGVETSPGSGLIHSVLIDIDGNVFATGNNDSGQLCLGDNSSRDVPVQVALPGKAVSAAVGADFTFILMDNGEVVSLSCSLI